MVSIRSLAVRYTVSYIIVLTTLVIASRWFWTYPQELNLAIEHQERDVISIQNAIQSTHDSLTSMAYDYAQWQISQQYSSIPEINQTSPQTKALFQLNDHEITYLAILNSRGEIPIALYRDQASDEIYDFDPKQRERLISTFYPTLLESTEIQIFERFLGNAIMTSAAPIYDYKETNKLLGWVIISWSLYGDNLKKLSDILQVKVTAENGISVTNNPFPSLYSPFIRSALPYRTRCLLSVNQRPTGCINIHHQEKLIPKLLTIKILLAIIIISLIPFIFSSLIMHYLIRPIENTTYFLRQSHKNKIFSKVIQPIDITELDHVRLAFNELIDTVNQQKLELERQSLTDPLTGIPNRRALDLEIEKSWNRVNRHGGKIALILVDIDHFKRYNDFYGHLQGDEVLIKVAQALQLFSRRTDEIAARYGGEEFVLLFQYNEQKEVESLMQVIIKTMEALHEPHQDSEFKYLTLSCGACWIESEMGGLKNKTSLSWIETADKALYQAKENGRNQYQVIPFDIG